MDWLVADYKKYLGITEFVECDVVELGKWLFEYACRYHELSKPNTPFEPKELVNRMDAKYSKLEKETIEFTRRTKRVKYQMYFIYTNLDEVVRDDIRENTKLLNP